MRPAWAWILLWWYGTLNIKIFSSPISYPIFKVIGRQSNPQYIFNPDQASILSCRILYQIPLILSADIITKRGTIVRTLWFRFYIMRDCSILCLYQCSIHCVPWNNRRGRDQGIDCGHNRMGTSQKLSGYYAGTNIPHFHETWFYPCCILYVLAKLLLPKFLLLIYLEIAPLGSSFNSFISWCIK